MRVFNLKRTHTSHPHGIFGVLDAEGEPFAVTIENHQFKIPVGEYICFKSFYNKGGYTTYEIVVPNRTRILLHKGNVQEDSAGCVLIAESFGILHGRAAILDSKGGFEEFIGRTHEDAEIKLIVTEVH